MSTLFNTLSIGYSGLSAAQVGINTTGHNISNAETKGYTRQRVIASAATPLNTRPGEVGNGVQIQDIKRVFDNFVYDRYTNVSGQKEYSDFETKTLEELSTYFPEIDGVGIKNDLAKYYEMWQTFADNPDNDAIRIALAEQTRTLADHIKQTQDKVVGLQQQVNDQLELNVNEVNDIAKQIADLNQSIDTAEAGGSYEASDLRDKRNLLEKNLAQLIGAKVNAGQLQANVQIDSNSNTKTGSYTISVNGFNIVDGHSYHPLRIDKSTNPYGFFEVSYERQDGSLIPMEEQIRGGKVGAILDLRGRALDTTTGMPTDGILQKAASEMDAFAKGLIEGTNNLYAQGSTTKMQSNIVSIDPNDTLLSSNLNIKAGAFDVVMYDVNGNEVARRTINVDVGTTMTGAPGSNSIQGQLTANVDDNGDNNAGNDIDDYITFNFQPSATGELRLELGLNAKANANGYQFAIADKLKTQEFSSGTNFAGTLGLSRFFDGNNARDIQFNFQLNENPTTIKAGYSTANGDNRIALDMVQQQFEKYDFKVGNETYNSTIYGMFDLTATYVGTTTNSAIGKNDAITAQFQATELEYQSTSKVNVDEEMTNLIKYQTSYGASAKVITTIDQMMQTLLGIKQ